MLGLHCRSDQLHRPDCQKFPTERDQCLVPTFTRAQLDHTRLLHERSRLLHDFNPTDNPIAARTYRSQQDPFTICSRTARLKYSILTRTILDKLDHYSISTRPLLDRSISVYLCLRVPSN